MKPGTGNVDFGEMFRLIESSGFTGHYMNGFGSLDDMLEGREYLLERAVEHGIGINSGTNVFNELHGEKGQQGMD